MSLSSQTYNFTQISRRNFLAVGGAGVIGLSKSQHLQASSLKSPAVIQILLNGGASQLETFDPKPLAPREIRGPQRAIETRIPGVFFAESLPKLAERANQLVVIRSLFHEAAPIHQTGQQLLTCGELSRPHQVARPISEAIASFYRSKKSKLPVVMTLSDEQSLQAQGLKKGIQSDFRDPKNKSALLYGKGIFAERFWQAARLIEMGVRYLSLPTFDHLSGVVSWDAHGQPEAPGTILSYRDELGPQFDQAFSGLLDDLQGSGLLSQTLIVCTGEMGRSARINEFNGRDHWTQAWSGILAGGGLEGGQVIGETDNTASEIISDPFPIEQIPAMILSSLNVNRTAEDSIATNASPDGQPHAGPISAESKKS